MREGLNYYRGWLWIAFRHSFGKSDAIAGFLGVLFPAIAHALGRPEVAMSDLAWEIPLGFFSTMFLVRLLLAPFWMRQESQKELLALRDERNQIRNGKGLVVFEKVSLVSEWVESSGIVDGIPGRKWIGFLMQLTFRNISENLVKFTVSKMSISVAQHAVDHTAGPYKTNYLYPRSPVEFMSDRIRVAGLIPGKPMFAKLSYLLEYDTDPPTRLRTSRKAMRINVTPGEPGRVEWIFEEEAEE